MASSVAAQDACLVVMSMVVDAQSAQEITCEQVASSVAPCINYLKSCGAVPLKCCHGVRALNNAAKTTPDSQTTCNFLVTAAKGILGLQPTVFTVLPGACCNDVRTLNNAAKTTPDSQATCNCLVTAAKGILGLQPNFFADLPGSCGF